MNEKEIKQEKNRNIFSKILNIIENIVYYAILIPLIIITLSIVYQQIYMPEKIPDVFGWKMFIVIDQYMDESLEYGDLAFTKNYNTDILNIGDVVAFRTFDDVVVIHQITDIETQSQIDNESKQQRDVRTFTMKTAVNETGDTKYVKDSKIEGILKFKIPFIRNNNIDNTTTTYNDSNNLYNTCDWSYSFIYCTTAR